MPAPPLTGAQVRMIRERCGLSQRGLARVLRVHFMTVWKLEHGYKPVTRHRSEQLIFVLATRQRPRPGIDLCPTCQGEGVVRHT